MYSEIISFIINAVKCREFLLKFHHKAKNAVQIIDSKKNKVNDEGNPLVVRAIVSCEWQISTKEGISSHIKGQESYTW